MFGHGNNGGTNNEQISPYGRNDRAALGVRRDNGSKATIIPLFFFLASHPDVIAESIYFVSFHSKSGMIQ